MSANFEIGVDTTQATTSVNKLNDRVKETTKNARVMSDAMEVLARSINRIPVTRIEWLAIAFIISQTIGNVAMLIRAMKDH